MGLIGESAKVGVYERNDLLNQSVFERRVGHHESATTAWTTWRDSLTSGSRSSTSGRWSTTASNGPTGYQITVRDHDQEWLGFSFCDQIVHDRTRVSLPAPTMFVLARAVLQVEHGITFRPFVIARRSVDIAFECGIGDLRIEVDLA